MTTTIQVEERTMEQLKQLKKIIGAGSYNEVIEKLLERSRQKTPSLFGFLGTPDQLPKILKELKKEKIKDDPEFYSSR